MAKIHTLDLYPHVDARTCLGCTDAQEAPAQSDAGADGAAAEGGDGAYGERRPFERGEVPAAPAADPRAWLEIELKASSGEALANERCRVKLPDGSVREGTTGPDGVLRLTGIPPGDCEFTLLDLDQEVWGPA